MVVKHVARKRNRQHQAVLFPPELIGMSFSRVILGGLLSSRARLRFPGRGHSVTRSSSLASKNQPMESCPVAGCLTEGCTSIGQKNESGPNAGFCQQAGIASVA